MTYKNKKPPKPGGELYPKGPPKQGGQLYPKGKHIIYVLSAHSCLEPFPKPNRKTIQNMG